MLIIHGWTYSVLYFWIIFYCYLLNISPKINFVGLGIVTTRLDTANAIFNQIPGQKNSVRD
jgi:hypothetical protein